MHLRNRDGRTPLHIAVKNGQEEMARLLLKRGCGVHINAQDLDGKTSLHLAVDQKDKKMAALLLERLGIDLEIQDRDGKTPFHRAIDSGCEEMVLLFLEEKPGLHLLDREGKTLLHSAVESGNERIFTLVLTELVEEGADLDARDREGKTAFDLAVAKGRKGMIAMLRSIPQEKKPTELKSVLQQKEQDPGHKRYDIGSPYYIKTPREAFLPKKITWRKHQILRCKNSPLIAVSDEDLCTNCLRFFAIEGKQNSSFGSFEEGQFAHLVALSDHLKRDYIAAVNYGYQSSQTSEDGFAYDRNSDDEDAKIRFLQEPFAKIAFEGKFDDFTANWVCI